MFSFDQKCLYDFGFCLAFWTKWKKTNIYYSLVAHMVKHLPAMQETRVQSLGHEDPLEKGVSTHSSILAWRIHGQRKLVGCSPWKSWKCSLLSRVWLFAIPPTEACQVPLSMGILWARILEWVALPSSRGFSQPRDWTQVFCIAGRFFTIWASREALDKFYHD